MKLKNELDRWHHIKEFAQMLDKYASFHERQAICKCVYYDWDQQSAEEYCSHPKLVDDEYAVFMPLNGDSQNICWKCSHYEIITGVPANSEESKSIDLDEKRPTQ